MHVVPIVVPHLGNRTHLVHDGTSGVVIDPPRDLAAVEAAAEEAGVGIVAVADTHVHNDYVSGAPRLAQRHGADYLLSADERTSVPRTGVRGGDVLWLGGLELTVLATPGHTLHHQSFLVRGEHDATALFSGGSLLHGSVGRTDLVDPLLARLLARAQWQSARDQAALPGDTALHPTHGFGSLCASAQVEGRPTGLLADELGTNPVFDDDRDRWVERTVTRFGPVPSYYRHMAPLNRAGAGLAPSPEPAALDADDLDEAARRGLWVVDVRDRHAFGRAHRPGAINIEAGPQLATYTGWLAPWGSPVVLVGDRTDDLLASARQLGDVGVEVHGVHVLGPVATWRTRTDYRVVDWSAYRRTTGEPLTLDVRLPDEHAREHLPQAVHVPLPELERRLASVPPGTVHVHCRSGFRAAIAASLLARHGRDVVLVTDDWEHAAAAGLKIGPDARAA